MNATRRGPAARGGSPVLSIDLLRGHGEATALTDAERSMSYRAFADRAEAVAERLRAVGAGPGTPVGLVSAGRSFDEPVGLAGILAAGCVAVPLDASAPGPRVAAILSGRGASVVVHDGELGGAGATPSPRSPAAILATAAEQMDRDLVQIVLTASGEIAGQTGQHHGGPSALEIEGDGGAAPSLACVLHTSGSTGVPKPVPITWEGLEAFTTWAADLIALSSSDRVLRVAELVFDLAWFDHIATWRRGASLLLLSRRQLAAGKTTLEAIEALGPTVIYGVPSLFMKLTPAIAAGRPLSPDLRAVFFAGEVFPPRELEAFVRTVPAARLFNFFGPTETNVCTFHEVDRAELDGETEIPIGVACPYAACELKSDEGAPVDGAGIGELWVTGPTTLGGGPFATRDRVERDATGRFHFRGRIDRMVKVRGYRVEPGDVEAALALYPTVRRAAVVVRDDARLGKTLWGFVEPRDPAERPPERQLRGFVAERLPPYMVPERVVVMDELPQTATGKIDYAVLLAT